MATRVNVTSVEAIESFRASLIIYLSKARPTLEEINGEVVRLRIWVQTTQRTEWEGVLKKRQRILEEARAAVFSSRMSNLREVSSSETAALTKAQRAVNEAEEKLRLLRKWDRDFDNQTEPIARQLEKLATFLSDDIGKAIVYLAQTLASLHAYTEVVAPGVDGPSGQPANSSATDRMDAPSSSAGSQDASETTKGNRS